MSHLTHRRVTWFILLVGLGLVLTYALVSTALIEVRGVGKPHYDLCLESANPLHPAGAEVCDSRESAGQFAARAPPENCRFQLDPDHLAKRRLAISVTRTTRHHELPRRVDYTQEYHLAVVAILADGRRVGKVVELPDARAWEDEPREVTVRLD